MPHRAPEPPPAAAAALLQARERLGAAAERLPRLREVAARLRGLVERWDLAPLARALRAERDAVRGLRFELLVPVGLRAATPASAAREFRDEVARVAQAAAEGWSAVQDFLQDCAARDAAEGHGRFELSRVLRQLEQRVAEAGQLTGRAVAELRQQAAGARSAVTQDAYAALARKGAEQAARVQALQAVAAAARHAAGVAASLADEREALASVLRRQAQGLAPPLLKALGRLIAPGLKDPPGQLQAAQGAAMALLTSVEGALEEVEALEAYARDLGPALAGLEATAAL